MSAIPSPIPRPFPARKKTPPIENGDRLTRSEFERRYSRTPDVKKAELIEGIVYTPSPVRLNYHGKPHALLVSWISWYASKTPGLNDYGDNVTVRLDEDNEPQPDMLLLLPKHAEGKGAVDEDDYVAGPPALVCEVSASAVSIDMHMKKNVYRRNRVQEYLVARTEDCVVDWFVYRDGEYALLAPDENGVIHSEVFPGLWLNTVALFEHNLPALFATVDAGIATPEHEKFVLQLNPSK